jgi:hypothetical protein
MVFGGIAGILPPEHGEPDDLGSLPSINIGRETGDLQDMYRRTLAASWTCRGGELPPDQLIEDIFAGGVGCPPEMQNSRSTDRHEDYDDSVSDTGSRTTVQGNSRLSPNPEMRPKSVSSNHSRHDSKGTDDTIVGGSSGASGSLENHFRDSSGKGRRWQGQRSAREVSEFHVRPDLRTWEITVKE